MDKSDGTSSRPTRVVVVHALAACGACVALAGVAHAQSPNTPRWLAQLGTPESDWATGVAPAGDGGGAFVVGYTRGSLGEPNAGGEDAFVARFDNTGFLMWVMHLGTSADDRAWAAVADGAGGVIVAGDTRGDLGGPSAGDGDAFVARIDGGGTLVWIRRFGTGAWDGARALAIDAMGVYVAGATHGNLGASNAGQSDVFVAKFDRDGHQIWVSQIGSLGSEEAIGIAPDMQGGAIIGGWTRGSLGGPPIGAEDAFIARFDHSGLPLWQEKIFSPQIDIITGVASDGAGGALVAGWTSGVVGLRGWGLEDGFIARLNPTGGRLWIRQIGWRGRDFIHAAVSDAQGRVVVAGETTYGFATPGGGIDVILERYSASGSVRLGSNAIGSTADDSARAIALDGSCGVFVAGMTLGDLAGAPAGREDVFVGHLAVTEAYSCYADCDGYWPLDIFDFLCFGNKFQQGDAYACNCDTSTGWCVCDIFDFICFGNAFAAGCE